MADGFKMDDQAQAPNSPTPPGPNDSSEPLAVTAQQAILGAVEANFVAQKTRAMANINAYLLAPVGVAEHPDVVGEVITLLKEISEADGNIQTLRRIVS